MSKRVVVLGAVALAIVGGTVAAIANAFGGSAKPNATIDNASATQLATVRRQPLSSQTQVSATLGYAGSSTIVEPAGIAPSALAQAQQGVASAKASLNQAEAALAADEQALARARGPQKTDAKAKVDSDRDAVTAAESSLASAESSLAAAESSATAYGDGSLYTRLPSPGRIVRAGEPLYWVNGEPVVLLYGPVTPWRAFRSGMSAGRDVAELNAALHLSGDEFTSATAAAIGSFQKAHGLEATGELLLGSVVFEPGAVRVTTVTPTVGSAVQPGPVLTFTSTRRQVTIQLDAAQQAEVKVGDPVTITLPDNTATPGKVTFVGSVATTPSASGDSGASQTPTIEVDVTPTNPRATGRLDQAPVEVSITTASVRNALAVPVNALLALASGGYAVEAAESGGGRRLLPVELGLFDDAAGLVEVTGNGLRAGQQIVVPAS